LLGKTRLGPLPLAKRGVPAGTYRVEVRGSKGKYSMTRQVVVRPGGELKVQLAPREGTIHVMVNPWAKITVDGRFLGITPLKPIKILEGRHVLVIENADLKAKQVRQVQVKPDQPTVIKVNLE